MQVSKVLVVDGDLAARDTLVTCLRFVGLEAHGADGASAARCWLATGTAEVLVLSDSLADGGPAELVDHCLPASARSRASILMLRRATPGVPVTNYAVDETLVRPIPVGRVVERVEYLIRERRCGDGVRLQFGDLTLDLTGARAELGARAIALGRNEARLLAFFIGLPDRVFSRAQLLQRLWPANVRVEERTVDVYIRRLRLALDDLGCPDYIQTVRGSGYRFSLQVG